jgi:hypothetical protein
MCAQLACCRTPTYPKLPAAAAAMANLKHHLAAGLQAANAPVEDFGRLSIMCLTLTVPHGQLLGCRLSMSQLRCARRCDHHHHHHMTHSRHSIHAIGPAAAVIRVPNSASRSAGLQAVNEPVEVRADACSSTRHAQGTGQNCWHVRQVVSCWAAGCQ